LSDGSLSATVLQIRRSFHIAGSWLVVLSMPPIVHELKTLGRWTRDELDRVLPDHLVRPESLESYLGRQPIFGSSR
jgi:hypothetical protein